MSSKEDHDERKETKPTGSMKVKPGIESTHDGFGDFQSKKFVKVKSVDQSIQDIAMEMKSQNRRALSQAITLVESNAQRHFEKGQQLLTDILPHTGKSIRIGITGVPGAGKSTFIETLGLQLCNEGHRVAVLAIDPSSSVSGGSILGDKTRMEHLAKHPLAFIRPSPSSGTLGGVHRKTRETILLCEAAGFDVIIIETVGVGQSETIVRSMVDFFLLIVLTGAGDELQGMKKGIMELADAVVVNKADGNNQELAIKTKREYNQILHFITPATAGWEAKAYTCSAIQNDGIKEIWEIVQQFEIKMKENSSFSLRRKQQTESWLNEAIMEQLTRKFYQDPKIKTYLPDVINRVVNGNLPVSQAVEDIFKRL
jgi:LAO/AO transport system kinase